MPVNVNGQIVIHIRNGRIGLETSLDPVLVSLCMLKATIKLLEEQVKKGGSLITIEGLSGLVM